MRYKLVGNICTNKEGLEKLVFMSHLNPENKQIEIDMSQLKFLEANLMAVFGAILYEKLLQGFSVKLINMRKEIEDILKRNHFLGSNNQYFNPSETAMEFKIFTPEKEREFIDYINEQLLDRTQFPKMGSDYKKQIRSKIQELFANAVEHGAAKEIFCCGQHFPKKGVINFTIVNHGATIKDNVERFLNRSLDSEKAITWASKEGHSTASSETNPTRGLGLSLLHEFIMSNDGNLSILSNDGFWCIEKNKQYTCRIEKKFYGTIINIIINVKDTHNYEL